MWEFNHDAILHRNIRDGKLVPLNAARISISNYFRVKNTRKTGRCGHPQPSSILYDEMHIIRHDSLIMRVTPLLLCDQFMEHMKIISHVAYQYISSILRIPFEVIIHVVHRTSGAQQCSFLAILIKFISPCVYEISVGTGCISHLKRQGLALHHPKFYP